MTKKEAKLVQEVIDAMNVLANKFNNSPESQASVTPEERHVLYEGALSAIVLSIHISEP